MFCFARVGSSYLFGWRRGRQNTHPFGCDTAFGIHASVLCFAHSMLLLYRVVLHGVFLCSVVFVPDIHYIVFFLVCISSVVVSLYIWDIVFSQTFSPMRL